MALCRSLLFALLCIALALSASFAMASTLGRIASHRILLHPTAPQDFELNGLVVDSLSRKPIVGASVELYKTTKGKKTKRDGSFEFTRLVGQVIRLRVSSVGYLEKLVEVRLPMTTPVIVEMTASIIEFESVIVEAKREPILKSDITTISREELDQHRGQTFAEALAHLPGVTLLQTGPSISKPVIRGMHSQRLTMINAGVAQESQQWGADHGPEIDPFAQSSVNIVRGTAGIEFGSSAIGGVIQILPEPFQFDSDWKGNSTLNYFSNNRQFAGSLALEKSLPLFDSTEFLAGRLQISGRRAGYAQTPDYFLANTGFRELDGTAMLAYKTLKSEWNLFLSRFTANLGIFKGSHIGSAQQFRELISLGNPINRPEFSYDVSSPRQEIRHDLARLSFDYQFSMQSKLELQYSWQQNDRSEYDAHNRRLTDSTQLASSLALPAIGLELTSHAFSIKFRHSLLENSLGSIGIDVLRQGNVRTGRLTLVPNYRLYSGGVFLIENIFFNQWTFNVGLRTDYSWQRLYLIDRSDNDVPDTSMSFSGVNGSIGAQLELTDQLSIQLTLSSHWRRPSVNELFSFGVHHGTATFEIGDSRLTSERAFDQELSAHFDSEDFHAEGSIFSNVFSNFIQALPDTSRPTTTVRGTFPTFLFSQSPAFLRGAELSCEIRASDLLRMSMQVSTVFGDSKDSMDRWQPIFQMPPPRANLTAHYHLDFLDKLTSEMIEPFIEVGGSFVARQTRNSPNADYALPPSSYLLFSASVGADILVFNSLSKLSVAVQNIFDTKFRDYLSRYRYFADDAGRNIVLRWSIPLNSSHVNPQAQVIHNN